ncbi:MAG: Uma2 family endonuclease [Saprospiraceae bacterium]|nr:MAG: Uma2 family endonuclease [Saprospiraceae bacterium]
MEIISKVPVTLTERLEYGEELRIPASWDEFLDLLEECEYRIEYDEGEIISFMGYAIDLHEKLAIKIGHLLISVLNEDFFDVYGSNLALHIPGFVRRYYNAGCAVVNGETEKVTLRGDMTAVANPVLLVEVLSRSGRDFDLNRKFRNCQKIPSLQQVLFIEITERKVVSHQRQNDWQPETFSAAGDRVPVLGEGAVSLDELYRKVSFIAG